MTTLLIHLWVSLAVAAPPTGLTVEPPPHNGGLNLDLSWELPEDDGGAVSGYAVLRATDEAGPYVLVADALPAGTHTFRDKVTTDPRVDPLLDTYWYRIVSLELGAAPFVPADPDTPDPEAHASWMLSSFAATAPVVGQPRAVWINTRLGWLHLMALIGVVGGLMLYYARRAQQGEEIFIRRIPGIDAIEEGIGRATEMGRPVLYVPGIDELQDIQTIASMLILGQVSETVAEYQADLIVSCCIPIVREVADEVVKAGFYQAGHPDAYNPADVRFISSEQFAFTAGTNGIIHREKPATNLYLGRFFAESLILAETGFVNRSIQIAGTAEATQLPFFVAACDYTLIGEELFAVSAYLSRDPRLVSSLKASDFIKIYVVVCLLLGTLLNTLGYTYLVQLFTLGEGG
ncbi:MAG TPA: fibronectin type III domain-containing protein [Deltaproteobacteria bacterium]|nr:fibronectin type III domain-containing protein [Deltaproteobacteria bacterium]